jgi:DNA-binding beta-propeller fold protein YncE
MYVSDFFDHLIILINNDSQIANTFEIYNSSISDFAFDSKNNNIYASDYQNNIVYVIPTFENSQISNKDSTSSKSQPIIVYREIKKMLSHD